MKTIGIIVEFNPFHNGHKHLIETAKKQANADRVVVVMSGSFVQRGSPAIFDKWTRASAALLNGVDMVLELPVLFATANAETFARYAVRTLEETGIVDTLCFGSESGNLSALQEAVKILTNETDEFRRLLRLHLDQGMSYPASRAKALETVSSISQDILTQPNDILALEYLMALEKYNCRMEPMTIKRYGEGHHSMDLSSGNASATAIRAGLFKGALESSLKQVPKNCENLYTHCISEGSAPVYWNTLMHALHYKLRTTSAHELKEIFEVTEGLEHRIIRSTENAYSMEEVIDYIKSKRYTRSKIQRILLHILLDIKTTEVAYFAEKHTLPYIRVLGFCKENADILGDLTSMSKAPVLTNLKKASAILDEDGLHLLALEKMATDLYAMASPSPLYRQPNKDFTTPMSFY